MPTPPHAGQIKGTILVSTNSTGQGWILDNNLPVMIAYSGYKTVSGEYTYDETDLDKYPIIAVEDKGDLIARGRWDITHTPWTKIGYNPDSSPGEELLAYQGGSPHWPASSGMPLYVISSVNGDRSGGTGVESVWIKYLDASYSVNTTVATLDGTTGVALVDTSIARILNFQAYTGVGATGNISIYPATGGVMSQIGVGQTRARNSMWTVPAEKTLYIKNIYYGSAAINAGKGVPTRFLLKTNFNSEQDRYSTSLFWPISANLLNDNAIFAQLSVPIRIPEKTDMYVSTILTANSSANATECILRGFTIDNT